MSKSFFKKYSPDPKQIKQNRLLSVLGEGIYCSHLWHLNRHVIARAFAVGLFFTWVPFPFQTLMAATLAVLLRANLPISVGLVFITNPITIPPLFYGAYWIGSKILNQPLVSFHLELTGAWATSTLETIWQPLVLGSFLLAVVSSIIGYFLIHLLWRCYVVKQWRKRRYRVSHRV